MIVDMPRGGKVSYYLQTRKCNKAQCKRCQRGGRHGPYWYAYWYDNGRVRSTYVGKQHPIEENNPLLTELVYLIAQKRLPDDTYHAMIALVNLASIEE